MAVFSYELTHKLSTMQSSLIRLRRFYGFRMFEVGRKSAWQLKNVWPWRFLTQAFDTFVVKVMLHGTIVNNDMDF